MNWPHLILFLVGLLYAVWHFAYRLLPALLENPILDPRGLPYPPLLLLDGLVVLPLSRRRSHVERTRSPGGLAGLVRGPQPQSVPSRQAAKVAPETRRSRPRHRGRRTPSSGRHPANLQPLLAHHPGAGPVHRRGNIRGRRGREDLGLYAPLRFHSFSVGKPETRTGERRPWCSKSRGGSAMTSARSSWTRAGGTTIRNSA